MCHFELLYFAHERKEGRKDVTRSYRKSGGPSPGGAADRSGRGAVRFFPSTAPAEVFVADHRRGGKRGRVITALAAVTGLPRTKRLHPKRKARTAWKRRTAAALPALGTHQTPGWSPPSGWASWAETCRTPAGPLASSPS